MMLLGYSIIEEENLLSEEKKNPTSKKSLIKKNMAKQYQQKNIKVHIIKKIVLRRFRLFFIFRGFLK